MQQGLEVTLAIGRRGVFQAALDLFLQVFATLLGSQGDGVHLNEPQPCGAFLDPLVFLVCQRCG
jgi:hypothetical protein